MRIFYPYNEILPKRKAHDVFIVQECAALAQKGVDVTLLCGRGSKKKEDLCLHYTISSDLNIQPLPIVRKNNPFNLSWNFPFFSACQKEIAKKRPDWVFLSVRKQGAYHLARKVPGVRYLYEVHELAYYPNTSTPPKAFSTEKEFLSQADLITVTTQPLKEILQAPPYALKTPIEVVPLAVSATPLPPTQRGDKLTLFYVGQLYEGQGISLLLKALRQVKDVHLKIIGGTQEEISKLAPQAEGLDVSFLGFHPPAALPELVKEADAFVAPFESVGRMPYVAHTKLYEYAAWGRPFIAPRLPSVTDHFHQGVVFFEAGNISSLAQAIQGLETSQSNPKTFTWDSRATHYQSLLASFH